MRKYFLIVLLFFVFLVFGLAIYFFVIPPKVINVYPLDQSQNVELDSSLIIKFNKPVARQKIEPNIFPNVHGEWRFEDSLKKNHLFRTLIFIPAINFKPDTKYQVKIKNIVSPLSIGFSTNFAFEFKTKSISFKDKKPPPVKPLAPKVTLLDVPFWWQKYPLSCEAASLRMALASKGIYLTEDEIMEKIGYGKPLVRKNNIWADPHKAYVGRIDGKICKTGYGVYWEPLAKAGEKWRPTESFSGWTLKDLIREINLGNPVLFWGVLPKDRLTDCSWYTPKGKYIKAFKETHVRVVVGYIGNPENPLKIIIHDPLSGRLYWKTSFFLKNWKVFDYSGVVVR